MITVFPRGSVQYLAGLYSKSKLLFHKAGVSNLLLQNRLSVNHPTSISLPATPNLIQLLSLTFVILPPLHSCAGKVQPTKKTVDHCTSAHRISPQISPVVGPSSQVTWYENPFQQSNLWIIYFQWLLSLGTIEKSFLVPFISRLPHTFCHSLTFYQHRSSKRGNFKNHSTEKVSKQSQSSERVLRNSKKLPLKSKL